jgi:hypothetical protein
MRLSLLFLVGCAGATKPSGETDSASTTTPSMMTVRYEVWEDDRQCWAFRDIDRPAEYWDVWYNVVGCYDIPDAGTASGDTGGSAVFATALADGDGLCAALAIPYDDCVILDPFLLPCDAVPGCCDLDAAHGPRCFPNYWEP